MRHDMDTIGTRIWVAEQDDSEKGTIHIEVTDDDELGMFLESENGDISVYVSLELWKKLYEMALKEIDQSVIYDSSEQSITEEPQ